MKSILNEIHYCVWKSLNFVQAFCVVGDGVCSTKFRKALYEVSRFFELDGVALWFFGIRMRRVRLGEARVVTGFFIMVVTDSLKRRLDGDDFLEHGF